MHKPPESGMPQFKAHLTRTHPFWANLIEVWFGVFDRQAIRRRVFISARSRASSDGWHDRAHWFVWPKATEHVVTKSSRSTTSNPCR